MRVFVLVLALLVCAAAVLANGAQPPVSQPSGTTAPATQPGTAGQGPAAVGTTPSVPATVGTGAAIGNQMVDQCMMNTFGLTSQQIQSLRSQGLSNSDIAMAAAISAKSGQPVTTVVSSWQSVGNWPDVARQYGVSMSDLTSMSAMASPDEEAFNTAFLTQYYGISPIDVQSLRQQGFTWNQINMMANAAARTGQPISQIAALRAQGCSWSQIATRFNVASATLLQPVACSTVTASAMTAAIPSAYAAGPTGCYSATVGAGPAAFGVVPTPIVMPPAVMYDRAGNVILTMDEVVRYYSQGYSWLDIAIAANIYRASGYPIQNVLFERRTGTMAWEGVIDKYGVSPDVAFNVCDWPFPKYSPSSKVDEATLSLISSYQKPCGVYGPRPAMSMMQPVCPTGAVPAGAGPICPPGYTVAPSGAGPVCPPGYTISPSGAMVPAGTAFPPGAIVVPPAATQPTGTLTTPSVPPSAPAATGVPPMTTTPGPVY